MQPPSVNHPKFFELVEFKHNQQLVPALRFLEPTLRTLVSAAIFRWISALTTPADSPTEFRAYR